MSFELSPIEERVFKELEIEPKSFDILINTTGLDFDNLMSVLTTLELKGIIKQTDGEKYVSCVSQSC